MAWTRRVMVGGRTCSAAARSPSVRGPPRTSSDSAERRARVRPSPASARPSVALQDRAQTGQPRGQLAWHRRWCEARPACASTTVGRTPSRVPGRDGPGVVGGRRPALRAVCRGVGPTSGRSAQVIGDRRLAPGPPVRPAAPVRPGVSVSPAACGEPGGLGQRGSLGSPALLLPDLLLGPLAHRRPRWPTLKPAVAGSTARSILASAAPHPPDADSGCRKQPTRWSLTTPTDCR